MKDLHFSRLFTVLALAVTLSCASLLPAQPTDNISRGGQWFTGIYAFGDSLSDTGNFFALTGQPPAPYYKGRVSNGIIWIEYLADALRLEAEDVVNYAWAGATTGRENENDIPGVAEFPGLQDELDYFDADLNGAHADDRALYVVWAGANDFFVFGPSAETMAGGIGNTVTAVERLYKAGARQIMVVNMPDLGLTPYGRSVDPAGLSWITAVYNSGLDLALDELAAAGIETIRVDASGVLQEIVANPGRYHLSNVTDSFLATGGNPARFLFWDNVHPTTRGHAIIAREALKAVGRRRSPSGR